jgi:hypothetical protein
MYVKDKKPEQLNVFENAFAINKLDSADLYNQIKGTRLNAWFNNGELAKMKCRGNAENVYFALDNDKSFIGVNHSNAQIIEITFENNEPAKVVFRNRLVGKMTPMGQTTSTDLKLNGFKWLESLRPKNKFDILAPNN